MTFIEQLADALRRQHIDVQPGQDEILATFRFANGRTQQVRLIVEECAERSVTAIIKIQSRIGVASSPWLVQKFLELNYGEDCGGFAIDGDCELPAIDLIRQLVVPGKLPVALGTVIENMHRIAARADTLESKIGGEDIF